MASELRALTRRAQSLKTQGDLEAAIEVYQQAIDAFPGSAVAEHNLGATLGDAGRHAEAVSHLQAALSKGINAPETWLALARSQFQLGELEGAENAYLEALTGRPTMLEAHYELAQMLWMHSGDSEKALGHLRAATVAHPNEPGLRLLEARVLEHTGQPEVALRTLIEALQRWPQSPVLHTSAAYLAIMTGDAERGLKCAERAIAIHGQDRGAQTALAHALLATGAARRAAALTEQMHADHPEDQQTIALMATAWRLLGRPGYRELYDYPRWVQGYPLATPAGWPDLPSYLAELAPALHALHPYRSHPFGQSVRHGSQVPNVTRATAPVIRALDEAIAGPIEAYLAALGAGQDPLRRRHQGGWRVHGIWSVRLPAGGFHASHVHPDGWISSACHIELPPVVSAANSEHAGWLEFGAPGMPTHPILEAEHRVQPEPGKLVLFPSYMWHGTRPFSGDAPRLTVAFDVVPG